MQRPVVLLVNPNRMLPPIAPLGLEYVAASLQQHGYDPVLCDLTFAEDWPDALTRAIVDMRPVAIGVSIRNIDDAYFASQDFILETTSAMVRHVQSLTDRPVVLGGVGFSCAPAEVLEYTGAAYGIAGDGEIAFPLLLKRLADGRGVEHVPGAVFRKRDNGVVTVAPEPPHVAEMPAPPRRFLDNVRYFAEGGQAGIETKRGCASRCIYCVDPVAKGTAIRLRSPHSVVDEWCDLLDQGIDVVHLCDSEFNLPASHARAVCDAVIHRGIAEKIRWYTYASPEPIDQELAQTMARAGCAGVNFGVDHVDASMLHALGRHFTPVDIRRAAQVCRDAGIAVMFDMLLGSPGETRESIARAIAFMRELDPECVGLSCGVRVYPHTPLARWVRHHGPLDQNPNLHGTTRDNENLLRPIFFVDAQVGADIHEYVAALIADDPRFFHAVPSAVAANYNYNNNSALANAIRNGARGAYWHILARQRSR